MSLLSWFGLKTPAPSAPQNTWSLTNTAFPASPRSPNRPLSRMGCGGDYRFQSRGRTAVGFYHPAGRPTASPAGYFYAQLSVCIVGLFWGVPACPRFGGRLYELTITWTKAAKPNTSQTYPNQGGLAAFSPVLTLHQMVGPFSYPHHLHPVVSPMSSRSENLPLSSFVEGTCP